MSNAHLPVGMVLVGVTVGFLVVRYFSRKKAGAFRSYGWIGLAMLILFEVLLFLRVGWVGTYFTPLCWTAYLLLTDAAVFSLKVSSRLSDSPRAFILLALASVPVVVPARIGQYLFAFVWVGFVLLLDPLNYAWGSRSLLREWESGSTTIFWSYMAAGIVCGIFWEFWNYWATARWLYIFPILQGAKIFEMPAPGFLGFPPFAVECFVMYETLKAVGRQLVGFRQGQRIAETYSSAVESK